MIYTLYNLMKNQYKEINLRYIVNDEGTHQLYNS